MKWRCALERRSAVGLDEPLERPVLLIRIPLARACSRVRWDVVLRSDGSGASQDGAARERPVRRVRESAADWATVPPAAQRAAAGVCPLTSAPVFAGRRR